MAAYGPLYAAHHQMPYQQAPRSGMQPLGLHQSHTQHQQQQQQQYMHYVSEPVMVCEESWPWDDNLLDSPGSDSFESASTTYDPPSDESIPESYSSSTASTAALIPAHAPYTTSGCQQSRFEVQQLVRPPQLYARSSGVPAVCKPPLAPATCQPFQASEHRRSE